MKNIFKKNQIIITAMAIMIAVAGYISFTNKDNPGGLHTVETTNVDLEGSKKLSEQEKNELYTETTEGEDTALTQEDILDESNALAEENGQGGAIDKKTVTGKAEKKEVTKVPQKNGERSSAVDGDKKLSTDIGKGNLKKSKTASTEDMLSSAREVTDNGELKPQESTPGEAVLASATQDAGFFLSAKLDREQVRAKNKATLKEIIENAEISGKEKKNAVNSLLKLTEIADKESAAETSLGAKGFDNAVVRMSNDKVEVIVNAPSLTQQQLAIIEDIVKKKTDITVEKIEISPVIINE
jgi:stage III sporulation protein AH